MFPDLTRFPDPDYRFSPLPGPLLKLQNDSVLNGCARCDASNEPRKFLELLTNRFIEEALYGVAEREEHACIADSHSG
jgi:hypothetical protein